MPRLKGKYDHSIYTTQFPRKYLMDKNFNYPLEEIARRHPSFAQRWTQISQQTRTQLATAQTPQQKHVIQQQANQQIWKEILTTIKK